MIACSQSAGCGGSEDDMVCPPLHELLMPTAFVNLDGSPIDSNGNPNDLESSTFVDHNGDGQVDINDAFDFDMDGVPDDFNGDGLPDNRFYFDDRAAWLPDADSFDDYENLELGIPRGVTPVPGDCPADGIATGPLDLFDAAGRRRFADFRPSRCCRRSGALEE
jgi:hypothetical protein